MSNRSDESVNDSKDQVDQNRSEFTPLNLNTPDAGTLRLIVGFFIGFSITVTAALMVQILYLPFLKNLHGSVVSDSKSCSDVGGSILQLGGSAVDAVIATAFCVGVINPHITGLGSGGYILIYDQRERKLLNAIDFRASRSNHSAIGVPGFVAGLALAHELYGILSWDQLIKPSEYFAKHGFEVTQTLMKSKWSLRPTKSYNANLNIALSDLFLGKIVANEKLADTLHYIATFGSSEFYRNILVSDLNGILNPNSVLEYKALQTAGIKGSFLGYDIITPGDGSGGPHLLNNLKYVNNSLSPLVSAVLAFANVADGWPASSASHIAAIDNNDVYVTMVSGLGLVLGSQIMTKSGYILNNMLEITNDEKQRPEVLFTPIIALQSKKICGRRILLGAGDVRDVAQALIYVLRNESGSISADIEAPRVRLVERKIVADQERNISPEDRADLLKNFHVSENSFLFPSINVIEKINDTITAYADSRGGGYYNTF